MQLVYEMRKREITIGRRAKDPTAMPIADLVLAGSKTISRRHAIIRAVPVSVAAAEGAEASFSGLERFEIRIEGVGKNLFMVNQHVHRVGDPPMILRHAYKITMDSIELTVELPPPPQPQTADAPPARTPEKANAGVRSSDEDSDFEVGSDHDFEADSVGGELAEQLSPQNLEKLAPSDLRQLSASQLSAAQLSAAPRLSTEQSVAVLQNYQQRLLELLAQNKQLKRQLERRPQN